MIILISSAVGSLNGVSLVRFYDKLAASHEQQATLDAKGNAKTWVEEASNLLSRQWPKGGSVASYSEKIINRSDDGLTKFYGLPCSYALVKGDTCIGYV